MPTLAADGPSAIVRTRLEPVSGVAIGQPATLYVDVFTDSFFTSGIELPALAVPGAVIRLSDERPPHINDTIRGANWVGIEHRYSITPIVAADLTIPAIEIGAHLGPGSQLATLKTQPVTLKVNIPAGAEGAFITHDLRIAASIDVDTSHLKVGDAFTRSVELTATGTPAMFIPDIALSAPPGLKAYPREPALSDSPPGAALQGRRTFAVTYVVQKAGDYELPSLAVRWWDLDSHRIETAAAPAVSLHAEAAAEAAPPPFAVPAEQLQPPQHRVDWRRLSATIAIVLAILCVSWWLAPYLRRLLDDLAARRRERHLRYLDSERYAFSQLKTALHGDERDAVAALYRWLDRLPGPETLHIDAATTSRIADAEFRNQAAALLKQVYGAPRSDAAAALADMRRELHAARRKAIRNSHAGARSTTLSALNP